MRIKVETEKKYYCIEAEKLIDLASNLNFKQVKKVIENDEYFTDIDSLYIKNRTCLRIRNNNNENLEITFKGKSNLLLGQYCKLENNITCGIAEYENFVNLLSSLGYYSYVEVEKERLIYNFKNDKYSYNIMIDKIKDIGGFVEFEIISEKEDSRKDELKKELDKFISKFESMNLKEANKPYRDIVAEYIHGKMIANRDVENLYINIDPAILYYQEDFYNKNKANINDESDMPILIDDYLDNLIFDNKELLVMLELLKKLNYKVCFTTKANKLFFNRFFSKLNYQIDNVIFDNTNNLDDNNNLVIVDENIKKINSKILIMINNKVTHN